MLPATFVRGFHDEESVKKMKYNRLGKTELRVSQIGFGCAPLGGLFGDYAEEEAISAVRTALKKGINYIDTAPYYGDGRSETVLGKALKGVPREAYYVATKVCRYKSNAKEMFDFSTEATLRSVDKSLSLLGLQYVDIIQVHDMEFAPNVDIIINETLPALEKVVAAGKARFIGVTGYPVSVLKEVIQRSKTPISTVLSYCRSTLIDNTLDEYLPYFQSLDLGIINAACVSIGLLTNVGPQPWNPAHQSIKDACAKAANYCKSEGIELGKLATYYSITKPGAVIHLLGMNDSSFMELNLDTVIHGLNEKERKALQVIKDKYFKDMPQRDWEGVEVKSYWKRMNSPDEEEEVS